jgi:quercetin dioxygenase-like cupin family protein
MPIKLEDGFTNPVAKEFFQCLSSTPEGFTMRWTVEPGGFVPFEHVHINQDEIFTVRQGEIRLLMDGREYIGRAGDTIVVPKGARHIAYNNRPETLDCIVEYRPGLDHYRFFQCFGGLLVDGYYDRKTGSVDIPRMAYLMHRMNCQALARPTSIPQFAFGAARWFFALVGTLAGWDRLYTRYTGSVNAAEKQSATTINV